MRNPFSLRLPTSLSLLTFLLRPPLNPSRRILSSSSHHRHRQRLRFHPLELRHHPLPRTLLHLPLPLRQRRPEQPVSARQGRHRRQPLQGQAHGRLRLQPLPARRLRLRPSCRRGDPRLLQQLGRRRGPDPR
ncbi:hypothetical protein M0R45_023992 [Rubus argutus]|uniref:Uncharacterized protein n=1 Tax=Rubus argutus TaxID=59490 RepID=A0AAW1WRS5_RUBAR